MGISANVKLTTAPVTVNYSYFCVHSHNLAVKHNAMFRRKDGLQDAIIGQLNGLVEQIIEVLMIDNK